MNVGLTGVAISQLPATEHEIASHSLRLRTVDAMLKRILAADRFALLRFNAGFCPWSPSLD
jgi:hypothetical protein